MLITEIVCPTGKLENGFSYFIRQNSMPKRRAELWLVIKVGYGMSELTLFDLVLLSYFYPDSLEPLVDIVVFYHDHPLLPLLYLKERTNAS